MSSCEHLKKCGIQIRLDALAASVSKFVVHSRGHFQPKVHSERDLGSRRRFPGRD